MEQLRMKEVEMARVGDVYGRERVEFQRMMEEKDALVESLRKEVEGVVARNQ